MGDLRAGGSLILDGRRSPKAVALQLSREMGWKVVR